jgi:hypothetical protein
VHNCTRHKPASATTPTTTKVLVPLAIALVNPTLLRMQFGGVSLDGRGPFSRQRSSSSHSSNWNNNKLQYEKENHKGDKPVAANPTTGLYL